MKRIPVEALAFAAIVAGASALPPAWLEYAPGRGPWRAFTSQLTHWSVAMTAANVVVLAGLGAWLELRSRSAWRRSVLLGALAVASWLLVLGDGPYRGASGIATALFAAVAVLVWPKARGLVIAAALIFAAKVVWEATGHTAPVGTLSLPEGIRVAWEAHVAGALAGWVAARMRGPEDPR